MSFGHSFDPEGVDRAPDQGRRRFLKQVCMAAAATVGLPPGSVAAMMRTVEQAAERPSVVWLHFQECTGCTESLLRTSHPDLAHLILDLVSLDYHETLLAGAGHQAEAALEEAVARGGYILVVEGAIPRAAGGAYCRIGGRTALDMLATCAAPASAIIALGSCASFGGLPAAAPNPTDAVGVNALVSGKPVVTLPGCPANPYNFLGTVLQLLTFGTLPELDDKGRPRFAYGRTIHEHCPRRPHFDAGRFANVYGDDNHRAGHCLYELGCKGPQTHARCSTKHFGEVDGAWPIGVGHPCVGCTEEHLLFTVPIHETVTIPEPEPGAYWPEPGEKAAGVSPWGTGLAGLVGGALAGAGLTSAWALRNRSDDETVPPEDREGDV